MSLFSRNDNDLAFPHTWSLGCSSLGSWWWPRTWVPLSPQTRSSCGWGTAGSWPHKRQKDMRAWMSVRSSLNSPSLSLLHPVVYGYMSVLSHPEVPQTSFQFPKWILRGVFKRMLKSLDYPEQSPSDARPVHGFYAKKNTPPAGRLNNTTILILLIYSCNNQDFKKIIRCNNRLSCKMYLERGNVAVSEPVGRFPSKIECKPDCPHIIKSLSNYPPIFNYL